MRVFPVRKTAGLPATVADLIEGSLGTQIPRRQRNSRITSQPAQVGAVIGGTEQEIGIFLQFFRGHIAGIPAHHGL